MDGLLASEVQLLAEVQLYLDGGAAEIPDEHLITPFIPTRRTSDKGPHYQFGKPLIEHCKAHGFVIANGRCLGDATGACTCYPAAGGMSLVD